MATIFWGGDVFAPKRRVRRRLHQGRWGQGGKDEDELVGLQPFLQESLSEAFGRLAEKVRDLEAVVGFELINEPHRGYIELLSPYSWDFNTDLAIGYFPSAVQSCVLLLLPFFLSFFPRGFAHRLPHAQLGSRHWSSRRRPSLHPRIPCHRNLAPRPPPSSPIPLRLALSLFFLLPPSSPDFTLYFRLYLGATWPLGMGRIARRIRRRSRIEDGLL
jgi:hypothetical protein